MPRHNPGDPPGDEPGRADRRLAAAVGPAADLSAAVSPDTVSPDAVSPDAVSPHAVRGLLDGPPFVALSGRLPEPGKDPSEVGIPRLRWRTGRPAAASLCLMATVFLCWFWWQAANATVGVSALSSINPTEASGPAHRGAALGPSAAPDSSPAAPEVESDAGGEGAGGDTGDLGDTGGNITVHVAGAVVRAGIVELPRGSRLHEAVAAAGGGALGADLDQLNLAAVLEDGQKVLVPRQGETVPDESAPASDARDASDAAARGSPGGGSAPAAGKVNLNTAGAEELATLPRVGPVLAQRIVDWRKQHGDFQRVEELDAVDGFGPKLLEGLLPLVRV